MSDTSIPSPSTLSRATRRTALVGRVRSPPATAAAAADLFSPSATRCRTSSTRRTGAAGRSPGRRRHHGDLAEDALGRHLAARRGRPAHLLVRLRQLPAHRRGSLLPQHGGSVDEHLGEPVRRLEEDHRAPFGDQLRERGTARARLPRQEPLEAEPVGREAGDGQGSQHAEGPGTAVTRIPASIDAATRR